jgi:hypothetical protein
MMQVNEEVPNMGLFSSTRNMVRRNSTVIRNRIQSAWNNVERFRRPTIKRPGGASNEDDDGSPSSDTRLTAKEHLSGKRKKQQQRSSRFSIGSNANWLLIWVGAAVVIVWGLALSIMFQLVDYNSLYESRHQLRNITKDNVIDGIFAMNPFQYEVVKHPLKTVGNGLVAVDDFVSKALVRKRSRRILDGRKEVITPISPIGKLYRKQPDFLLELQMNDGRKPKKEIGNAHTKRNIQRVFEQAATAHYRATTAILEATKAKRDKSPKKPKKVDYQAENRDYYTTELDKLADVKLKELKAQKRKRKQIEREEELGIRKYNNEYVQSLKHEIKKKSDDQQKKNRSLKPVRKLKAEKQSSLKDNKVLKDKKSKNAKLAKDQKVPKSQKVAKDKKAAKDQPKLKVQREPTVQKEQRQSKNQKSGTKVKSEKKQQQKSETSKKDAKKTKKQQQKEPKRSVETPQKSTKNSKQSTPEPKTKKEQTKPAKKSKSQDVSDSEYEQDKEERMKLVKDEMKMIRKENIDNFLVTDQEIKQRESERRAKQKALLEARKLENAPKPPPKHVFEHDEGDVLLNWVNFLSSTLNKVKESITKSADDVIKQIKTMNAEDDDEIVEDGSDPADLLSKKEKKEMERAALIKKARQEKIDKELENADYPVIKRRSDKDFKFRSGLSYRSFEISATVPLTKQYNFLPIEQPNFLVGDYDDDDDEEEDDEYDENDETAEFEASVAKVEKKQARKVQVSESYAKQELDSKIREIQNTIEQKLAGLKKNSNLEKINAYIGKRVVNKRTKRLQFDKQIQLEKAREKSRSKNSKFEKSTTPDTTESDFDLFVDNNRQTVDNVPVNKDELKYFCPESDFIQAESCEGIEFRDIRYRSPVQDVPVGKISIKTKGEVEKVDDSGIVVKIWRGLMSLISKSRGDEVEKEEREKRELAEKLQILENERLEKEEKQRDEERLKLERKQQNEFEEKSKAKKSQKG